MGVYTCLPYTEMEEAYTTSALWACASLQHIVEPYGSHSRHTGVPENGRIGLRERLCDNHVFPPGPPLLTTFSSLMSPPDEFHLFHEICNISPITRPAVIQYRNCSALLVQQAGDMGAQEPGSPVTRTLQPLKSSINLPHSIFIN